MGVISVSVIALQERLLKAGEDLLNPPTYSSPSSLQRLLNLLNELFHCLSEVEQDPPSLLSDALTPSINALVAIRLFMHSNVDVKVTVAACITQIMRITAPDAPYEDEKMEEVFQLIVSSFEHLSDIKSCSYAKRISILDTVSKLRISVLMFDVGCDALLTEMFHHFLKALRDDHPVTVFESMSTIMTLVLDESEEISPELLSPILDYVKKDDEIPQVSQRLAAQVLSESASKLKTCLAEAVKASGVSLDKYSNLVASICEGTFSEDSQGPREAAVKQDNQKIAEVSTPEQTCVHAASSSRNKNGHEAVSPRRETVAGVKTRQKRTHEMVQLLVTKEEDPAEAEIGTHKRARVESCSLHEAHDEMGKTTAAEGEPSCRNHKSSAEPERKKLPKPGSVSDQLAKVKQSIVDTITIVRQFRSELETKEQSIVDILTSVRHFRSEIKKKEDNLEASLQEVDVLGEKIMGINKILNS